MMLVIMDYNWEDVFAEKNIPNIQGFSHIFGKNN